MSLISRIPRSGFKIPTIMSAYFFVYMMMSAQFLYPSLFLSAKGLTSEQIGLVMGLPPFIAILGQYFWSGRADRSSSVNQIVLILCAGASLTLPLYLISGSYVTLLATTVLYNFFASSILSTFDTLNLYRASEMGYRFGPLKIPGSIGYLVCVMCVGFLLEIDIDLMIYWQMFFAVFMLLAVSRCPKVTMPRMKKAAFNPLIMLKKPSVFMGLMLAIVIHFIHGANGTFFAPYLTGDLGASTGFVGVCSISSIAVEMLFLSVCDRLCRRFSTKVLLIGIASLQAIRLFAFGTASSPMVVWIFNSIDGISTVATYFFLVTYFKRVAPREGKASAQALVSIICSNGARAIGSICAPYIVKAMGSIANTYIYLSIVMAVTIVIFALTPVHFVREEEIPSAPAVGTP